ncbi:MAG TPA: hypothetical protein VHB21_10155 [Minicystis sp.]|nr:hypothetical protein [Minicystis sp.]
MGAAAGEERSGRRAFDRPARRVHGVCGLHWVQFFGNEKGEGRQRSGRRCQAILVLFAMTIVIVFVNPALS